MIAIPKPKTKLSAEQNISGAALDIGFKSDLPSSNQLPDRVGARDDHHADHDEEPCRSRGQLLGPKAYHLKRLVYSPPTNIPIRLPYLSLTGPAKSAPIMDPT